MDIDWTVLTFSVTQANDPCQNNEVLKIIKHYGRNQTIKIYFDYRLL